MVNPRELKKEGLPIGWHEVNIDEACEKLDGNVKCLDNKTSEETIKQLLVEGMILKSFNAWYIGVPNCSGSGRGF